MTRVLELFAGCGGMALAWHRAGAEHVGFVERDSFARSVLRRHWPQVPQHDDVTEFNASAYADYVDVLSGGPPCQPVSTAGSRKGTEDERWLWGAFVAAAVACRAPVVVAENPPALLSANGGDAFFAVLCALGDAGYVVEWDCLAAGAVGAPHRRDRVWLVATRAGHNVLSDWPATLSMFPGRPAAWPRAGRWERHTLATWAPRWPTPSPLPWEVAAEADALPTPTAACGGGGEASADYARHGGPDLRCEARRRALPTPTAVDAVGRDYQSAGGKLYPTLGHAAKSAAGVESQMDRRRPALPTPVASDGAKDPTNSLSRVIQTGSRNGRGNRSDVGAMLSPLLPEWMMGMPLGWTEPEGPSLVDAAPEPWLPDLTADLALTTERRHRRDRLRCVGNSVCVPAAEVIARRVLDVV